MPIANQAPVIFLAFANAQDDTVRYLRNLPQELRLIRQSLQRASTAALCEIVERANATIDDIFDVFQQYRHRIAVFHYGGHANGYQLLLETAGGHPALAHARGLTAFLGEQHGLQLVFLNGCSTQRQVEELLQANIPTVIATAVAIDDGVATAFAARFYDGLASGASIQTAYNEAVAASKTTHGDHPRHLYGVPTMEGRWPWDLYIKSGADVVAQWNLPEAAGDPLFALPPLALCDLPPQPFRYLRWFGRDEAALFFGRGHQIRALYERVTDPHAAPIILLHGQVGVGKSSLLAAGLLPRLEGTHHVSYRRRSQELGLTGTVTQALSCPAPQTSLHDAWLTLERAVHRPVVLVLDQVEETYTLPGQALPSQELADFVHALTGIFGNPATRPQGKLILGFRKEWLPEIHMQLQQGQLFTTPFLLERLDLPGIIEAVTGITRDQRLHQHYGLTIEAGLPEIIAQGLLEDTGAALAPTLQILLTKMWEAATTTQTQPLHFDRQGYYRLKNQGILLTDFLDQQFAKLKTWRAEVVDSGLALDLLALHTTPLGTAEQHTCNWLRVLGTAERSQIDQRVR